MDERFMQALKSAPDPEFARRLRDQLGNEADAEASNAEERPRARWVGLLAPALAVALLASVILFPSVRASAQAFLDLFRIRNFTAVSVNPERIRQLQEGKLDLKSLIGDRVETVIEPGPPQTVASAAAAGAAAGIQVKVPNTLPSGLQPDSVSWRGPGEARVTADVERLNSVLQTLGIRDVAVPMAIDGQKIEVKVPAVVRQSFSAGKKRAEFLQAKSPEVSLPAGVDLAALGEIGLRILGLERAEAQRLARSIDWRSTMLIPVPGNAGSFRQVSVNGQPGLLVAAKGERSGGQMREGAIVLWSRGDMVYALSGNLSEIDILQMANSVN